MMCLFCLMKIINVQNNNIMRISLNKSEQLYSIIPKGIKSYSISQYLFLNLHILCGVLNNQVFLEQLYIAVAGCCFSGGIIWNGFPCMHIL